jgi:hypothetical protein
MAGMFSDHGAHQLRRRLRHASDSLLWLGRKHKRIALAPARFRCPHRLGLGDVSRVDRNNADATPMRRHHYPIGLTVAHTELSLQQLNDELPRRVVIVHEDDLVKTRSLSFWQNFEAWLGDGLSHRIIPLEAFLQGNAYRS